MRIPDRGSRSDPWCLAWASLWVDEVHICPHAARDPLAYLEVLERVAGERQIDVVLPTHEQAWLLAVARPLLSQELPVAVADIASFERVQSKIEFARLLDELELPQPRWQQVTDERDLAGLSFPYWLKAAFSTAGQGVREITDERSRAAGFAGLQGNSTEPLMAQETARGRYGQVQGLFDRGAWWRHTPAPRPRLGSAAARLPA